TQAVRTQPFAGHEVLRIEVARLDFLILRNAGGFRTRSSSAPDRLLEARDAIGRPCNKRMIASSVAAAVLLLPAAARYFRRRSEGQYLGCGPHSGREFKWEKTAARKG